MEPDDLYGLALDRFIPERTELTRALRADKRRDDAAAVAALRKPSVAAWAVNQLVRSQGAAVQELYAAGDALRDAQAKLLAGSGDGRSLRAANERERAAVDTLVAAARGLLDSDGHELSPAVIERVDETLHAAALDEPAREQVRAGRLERELRHAGLGIGESVFAPAPPAAKPAKPPAKRRRPAAAQGETKQQRAQRARAAREEAEEEKRREREHEAARKAARSAETTARRRAERSAHALRAAQKRQERAVQALGEADDALAAAQAEAQAAAAEHKRAKAALERL